MGASAACVVVRAVWLLLCDCGFVFVESALVACARMHYMHATAHLCTHACTICTTAYVRACAMLVFVDAAPVCCPWLTRVQ